MQKRLRVRFLLICWGLLTVFLIAIGIGIGMYLNRSAVRGTEEALKKAAESGELTDDTRGMALLHVNGHGEITQAQQTHLALSEETLSAIVRQISPEEDETLSVTEFGNARYRYIYVRRGGGAVIYLAECTLEQNQSRTLRIAVPLFILLGTLLLLPVSMLLSHWTSKPIEAAWDKQSDFVSDATHELKTPLSVIAADTEAVLSNPGATIESQERWLESIQGETGRMADLVANLLFLAKIDAGEIKLDSAEFPISEQIEGACMEREGRIFESGRMLEYELTPDLKYRGDSKRIMQMIGELLDNAEQYTPAGGEIRVVVNRDRRQHIRVVITNTGTPLSPEECEKVFDRFYRADPSRSRETGGYGLGLCVARSIAELHGGTVSAAGGNGVNVFTVLLGEAAEPETQPQKKP